MGGGGGGGGLGDYKGKTVNRHVQLLIPVDGCLNLSKFRRISQGIMAAEQKKKGKHRLHSNQHQLNPSDNNITTQLAAQ